MTRPIARALVCLVLAMGGVAGTTLTGHAAAPTLDPNMWARLAALPSYHVESTITESGAATGALAVTWTEDAHGKDYHLVFHTSGRSAQSAEFYFVNGHFYVGSAGKFADLGAAGQQISAPILAMTLNYWAGVTKDSHSAQYVGQVMTAGRPAYRFKVLFAVSVPGVTSGTTVMGGQSLYYGNTVDVDMKTHAPILVSGTYRSTGGQKGQNIALTTRFAVTHIGQVPPIKAPPTLGLPGL
jgi:hypothetical protein